MWEKQTRVTFVLLNIAECSVDGRSVLKRILQHWVLRLRNLEYDASEWEPMVGCCDLRKHLNIRLFREHPESGTDDFHDSICPSQVVLLDGLFYV